MLRSLTALAALAVGCGAEPGEPSAPASFRPERVVISPIGVSLAVPPGYAVYPRGGDPGGVWVVDMNPGGRQPRVIVLDPNAPDQLTRPAGQEDPACPWVGPLEERLGGDSAVRYFARVGCGGSGGIQGALAGLWDLDGRRFAVSCVVQSELGEPDPASCLEQLRSARAVPATDTPVRLGPSGTEQSPLILAPPLVGTQTAGEPSD